MTTPDPITTAREASQVLCDCVPLTLNDKANPALETIDTALDYADAEIAKLQNSCAEWEKALESSEAEIANWTKRWEALVDENISLKAAAEKLKAERDEALSRLLSAGAEKPTAEDMDWAISLSASLRREEIAVEDSEITRLTSQLEQCKADDRKAMEVIERQKEEVFQANKMARDLEITAALLKIELEQAERVIAPFAAASAIIRSYNDADVMPAGPIKVANIRAASQWIKDRQAKGEAS